MSKIETVKQLSSEQAELLKQKVRSATEAQQQIAETIDQIAADLEAMVKVSAGHQQTIQDMKLELEQQKKKQVETYKQAKADLESAKAALESAKEEVRYAKAAALSAARASNLAAEKASAVLLKKTVSDWLFPLMTGFLLSSVLAGFWRGYLQSLVDLYNKLH